MFGFRTPPKKKNRELESLLRSNQEDNLSNLTRRRSTSETRKKLNTYGKENITSKSQYQKSKTEGIVKNPNKKPDESEETIDLTKGAESLELQKETSKETQEKTKLPVTESIAFEIPLRESELNKTFSQINPKPSGLKPADKETNNLNPNQNKGFSNPTTQLNLSNIQQASQSASQSPPTTQIPSSTIQNQNLLSNFANQDTPPITQTQRQFQSNPTKTYTQTQAPSQQGPLLTFVTSHKTPDDQNPFQIPSDNLNYSQISENVAKHFKQTQTNKYSTGLPLTIPINKPINTQTYSTNIPLTTTTNNENNTNKSRKVARNIFEPQNTDTSSGTIPKRFTQKEKTIIIHENIPVHTSISNLNNLNQQTQNIQTQTRSTKESTDINQTEENFTYQELYENLDNEHWEDNNIHYGRQPYSEENTREYQVQYENEGENIVEPQIQQIQAGIMALRLSDVIKFDIPFFKGNIKELNGFINTCSMYNQLTPIELKPILLTIIKSKITGKALAKIQPIDEYMNWHQLQEALKTRVKKPVSYKHAHEEINTLC